MTDKDKELKTKKQLLARGWTEIAPGVYAARRTVKPSQAEARDLAARKKKWERRFEDVGRELSVFLSEDEDEPVSSSEYLGPPRFKKEGREVCEGFFFSSHDEE